MSQQPGVYPNMPADVYHSSEGISKTGVWTLHTRTPADYKFAARVETKAMVMGTASHTAILEPDLLERLYVVVPESAPKKPSVTQVKAKNPSYDTLQAIDWWRQFGAENAGRTFISQADMTTISLLRDSLHADPHVSRALRGAVFEQSAFARDERTGIMKRCRPDIYNPTLNIMVDLKTTADADKEFIRSVCKYGYHVQDAFYRDVWAEATGKPVETFVFLACEPKNPHRYALYELGEDDVAEGRRVYEAALTKLKACIDRNEWPALPKGVQPLTLPAWARTVDSYADEADAA